MILAKVCNLSGSWSMHVSERCVITATAEILRAYGPRRQIAGVARHRRMTMGIGAKQLVVATDNPHHDKAATFEHRYHFSWPQARKHCDTVIR
jgi:hypothetical protein